MNPKTFLVRGWSCEDSTPILDTCSWTGVFCAQPGVVTAIKFSPTANVLRVAMSGTVPRYLSDFSSLWYVNLSSMGLHGSIPGQLGRLHHLRMLDLSSNSLSGAVPSSLCLLNLMSINLENNVGLMCVPQCLVGVVTMTGKLDVCYHFT